MYRVWRLCLHLSENLPSFETPTGKVTALRANIILQYLVYLWEYFKKLYGLTDTHGIQILRRGWDWHFSPVGTVSNEWAFTLQLATGVDLPPYTVLLSAHRQQAGQLVANNYLWVCAEDKRTVICNLILYLSVKSANPVFLGVCFKTK